ncbi:MAG: tetratricopeptide repeat protein [Chloroflexota bacterium]|nr:tetratricopeptide repeat protein [Chloroflexota bacterium]
MKEAVRATPNVQLKRARIERCLSQSQLAGQIGTTSHNVSRWERGITTPGPHFRQKLCAFFEKQPQELGLSARDKQPAAGSTSQQVHTLVPRMSASQAVVYDPALPTSWSATQRLIGRDSLLARMKQRLCEQGASLALAALNGLPGVGKTSLAVALAHDAAIKAYFHGGILWAGLGRDPNVNGLLGRWGTLLGLTPTEMAQLTSTEEWSKALRLAIGPRRILLIIDDAWHIEHALAFKVGGPNCVHLLTTRIPEIALQFAGTGTVVVHELSEDDGVALLAQLVPQVVAQEPEEVRTLVRSVGALPLALTLIGKYLQMQIHSGQPRRLCTALNRLRRADERLRLSQPQSPVEASPNLASDVPLSLQAVIGVSERHLNEQARSALRALSVFPPKPNTFSEEAALAVSRLPVEALDTLTDAGLLEGSSPGRYQLHQTISDYARLHLSDPAAQERLVAFFVAYMDTYQHEYDALDLEADNLFTALQLAFEREMSEELLRGVNALTPFLQARGLYASAELHLARAQQVATVLGDQRGLTLTWLHLGYCAQCQGNLARAEQLYREGLEVAHRIADRELMSILQTHRGEVATNRGDYVQARAYLLAGLELARQLGDQQRICVLLKNLGEVADHLGEHARGAALYQEGASALLQNLGVKAEWGGDYAAADRYYQEGLAYANKIGHRSRISALFMNMGVLAMKQGNTTEAEALYHRSLDIARTIGHRLRMSSVLQNLGILEGARERYELADQYMQESLELAYGTDSRWYVGETLCEWAKIHLKRRKFDEASKALNETLATGRDISSPYLIAQALFGLARIEAAQGNYQEARAQGQESQALFESLGLEERAEVARWLDSLSGI